MHNQWKTLTNACEEQACPPPFLHDTNRHKTQMQLFRHSGSHFTEGSWRKLGIKSHHWTKMTGNPVSEREGGKVQNQWKLGPKNNMVPFPRLYIYIIQVIVIQCFTFCIFLTISPFSLMLSQFLFSFSFLSLWIHAPFPPAQTSAIVLHLLMPWVPVLFTSLQSSTEFLDSKPQEGRQQAYNVFCFSSKLSTTHN